ncbi:MAG: type I-E CRISPR-associated protein Cas6/Cse3/CasE [Nannocystis sp.]|nr:type I-E CRISPR-associated protein Cas6/Cse3/CasE [Nannocystis sp.]
MTSQPLHLLRLDLDVPSLYGLARDHGLVHPGRRGPVLTSDLGYVLHAAFMALFGEHHPELFAQDPSASAHDTRRVRVLAYSEHDLAALREHAQTYADPSAYRLIDWERAASKPMPATWREGQRLGFHVRACPTVRMAKSGPHHREGAEVDAYIAATWRADADVLVDREAVYRDWLAAAFTRNGAAKLEHATLENFHLEPILRRTQGDDRRARPNLRKPDAILSGALTLTDPAGFDALLRRGVGRHRAFGFGMLLLRPERRPC